MRYGYARVSTVSQDLSIQVNALEQANCDVIRQEKVSGNSLENRAELNTLLDFLREGDELVVVRIDRLARSIRDLQNIVHSLTERGVKLTATEQNIDTSTASGKAFLDMLGIMSEFETNLRRERQLEGVARAKSLGKYKGRKASIDSVAVKKLINDGLTKSAVARQLNISRASVYRVLN